MPPVGLSLANEGEVALLREYLQIGDDVGYFGSASCVLAAEVGAPVNEAGSLHMFAAMLCFVGDEPYAVDTQTDAGDRTFHSDSGVHGELSARMLREFHLDELLPPVLVPGGAEAVRLSAARGGLWVFTGFPDARQAWTILDVLFRRRRQRGLDEFEEAEWTTWLKDGDTEHFVRELLHRHHVDTISSVFGLHTVPSTHRVPTAPGHALQIDRLEGAWEVSRLFFSVGGSKTTFTECCVILTSTSLCVLARPKRGCFSLPFRSDSPHPLQKRWRLDQIVAVGETDSVFRVRAEWMEQRKRKEGEKRIAGELTIVLSGASSGQAQHGSLQQKVADAWYMCCAARAEELRDRARGCASRGRTARRSSTISVGDGALTPLSASWAPYPTRATAGGTVPIDVLRRLAQHFDSISRADADGWVSRDDFIRAFGPLLQSKSFADAYFNVFRCSHRDKVNFIEFLAGMTDMLLGSPRDKLRLSFRLFDQNRDGQLDESEFVGALLQLHQVSNAKLPKNQSLAEFATTLFQKLSTVKQGSDRRTISLEEYQQGMLSNSELHKAFRSLGAMVVDWKAEFPKAEKGGVDSTAAQAKARAAKFVLFGHKDWGLVSHILHGIKKAAQCADDTDALPLWLSGGEITSPDWAPNASEMGWLQESTEDKRTYRKAPGAEGDGALLPDADNSSQCLWQGGIGRRDIVFTDYAPQVFRALRSAHGVTTQEYTHSLGIDNLVFNLLLGSMCSLRQMSSSGQSGSFFFLSHDEKYILKSLPGSESAALRKILPTYALHMLRHPDTLITRFCGLYSLTAPGRKKCTFVAMTNVFNLPPGRAIRQLYDLKGSTLNRNVPLPDRRDNVALKDLNLNRAIPLRWDWRERLLKQLHDDTRFLATHALIDYSFLLGVDSERSQSELRSKNSLADRALRELKFQQKLESGGMACIRRGCSDLETGSCARGKRIDTGRVGDAGTAARVEPYGSEAFESGLPMSADLLQSDPQAAWQRHEAEQRREALELEGGRIEHDSVFTRHNGGMPTRDSGETVYVGIIDILTQYGCRKMVEHRLKRMRSARMRMSCVPPVQYRTRFLNFLHSVLAPQTESSKEADVRLAPQLRLLQFHAVSQAGLPVRLVLVKRGHRAGVPALVVLTPVAHDVPARLDEEILTVRDEYPLDSVLFSRPFSLLENGSLVVCPRPSAGLAILGATYRIEGGVSARHQLVSAAAAMCPTGAVPLPSEAVVLVAPEAANRATVEELQERVDMLQPRPDLVIVVSYHAHGSTSHSQRLSPALLRTHHVVVESSSGEVCSTVLLAHSCRGVVTQARAASSKEVPGTPVCCAMQLGDVPFCVVATGQLDSTHAYQDAFTFVSSSLHLGARMDIVTLFPFIVWVTATGEVIPPAADDGVADSRERVSRLWAKDPFARQRREGDFLAGFAEAVPSFPPALAGAAPRRAHRSSTRIRSALSVATPPLSASDHRIDTMSPVGDSQQRLGLGGSAPSISHTEDGDQQGHGYVWPYRVLWRSPNGPGLLSRYFRLREYCVVAGEEATALCTPAGSGILARFRMSLSAGRTSPPAASRRPLRHELLLTGLSYTPWTSDSSEALHVCILATFMDGAVRTSETLARPPGAAGRGRLTSPVARSQTPSTGHVWQWDEKLTLVPPGLEEIGPYLEEKAIVVQVRAHVVWVSGKDGSVDVDASEPTSTGSAAPQQAAGRPAASPGDDGERVVDAIGQGVLPLAGLCDGADHHFEIRVLAHGLPAGVLRGQIRLAFADMIRSRASTLTHPPAGMPH